MGKTKVMKIYEDQAERSQYPWRVLLGENGQWGYTTSQKYEIGSPVEFEERDKEFKFYAVKGSWRG